jgi:hypothetical protein
LENNLGPGGGFHKRKKLWIKLTRFSLFCRMSSEVILNCWICPETFSKTRALNDHAIGKHSVCIHEERMFARMSELTKYTNRKHQDLASDLLEG